MAPKSIHKSITKSLKNQTISALNSAPNFNTIWHHVRPSRPLIFELSPRRDANFHIFAISQTLQKLSKKCSNQIIQNSTKIDAKSTRKSIKKRKQKKRKMMPKWSPNGSRNLPEFRGNRSQSDPETKRRPQAAPGAPQGPPLGRQSAPRNPPGTLSSSPGSPNAPPRTPRAVSYTHLTLPTTPYV